MSSRRPLRLSNLDDVISQVDRLHRGGYDQNGKWNLSQICEHLADWMTFPMDGFPKMPLLVRILLGGMRTLRGKALLRKFIESQSMPANQPTSPETVHTPGDETASVKRLIDVINRLKAHSGPIHPSPLFGPFTKDELLALQVAHCCHHLGFLAPKA